MEDGGEAKTKAKAMLCEECKAKESKYKCPGCSIRSCSLPCVKGHKIRTSCTGKRSQTHFVPISQMDDNLLLSDYNLLEEVKRVADSAQRLRNKLCRYNSFRLPFYLKSLRGAAFSRRTKLLFLPTGMSKRDKNQTRYDTRKKCITWTIEWRFHSTDVVLIDHGVNENRNLSSVLEDHLQPGPWNHKLRQFCIEQLDCLKLFIRKRPKGTRSPFRELDLRVPIRQQLANLDILEYPVIYVFLPSHSIDFEVVKDVTRNVHKQELQNYGSNDPGAGGVPFREEEIEEDNSCPKVLDLKGHETSVSLPHISNNSRCEKGINNSSDRSLSATLAAENGSHSSSKDKEQGLFEDMEFDFDQGLIDSYSDLIAEINPDDFLDLDGEGIERNLSGIRDFLLSDDDIEEGEILE
ncbi:putative Zinc finger, HIT-type [Rosa chinensis]|uniref:Box C/D snoRNA protein 1 n=1 Tax=Rosa chinensis TaxID=74649 RepID=A0A2P6PFD7_ROSCH|nr:box C/D snoRNA protein 1 [Rosa chinensis]PRQ20640.1 putative Zinc finger, HIT-type [Rosa chinensis]